MPAYVFDLDYTLYSSQDVNEFGNDNDFYNSFKKKNLLNKLLDNLKGNKYIFTNGNKAHLDEVSKKMRFRSKFKNMANADEYSDFLKPHINSYLYVIQKFNLKKNQEVYFFEDSYENLVTAKKLGWKTVFISNEINEKYQKNISKDVDFIFPNAEQAILFFINLQKNK